MNGTRNTFVVWRELSLLLTFSTDNLLHRYSAFPLLTRRQRHQRRTSWCISVIAVNRHWESDDQIRPTNHFAIPSRKVTFYFISDTKKESTGDQTLVLDLFNTEWDHLRDTPCRENLICFKSLNRRGMSWRFRWGVVDIKYAMKKSSLNYLAVDWLHVLSKQ